MCGDLSAQGNLVILTFSYHYLLVAMLLRTNVDQLLKLYFQPILYILSCLPKIIRFSLMVSSFLSFLIHQTFILPKVGWAFIEKLVGSTISFTETDTIANAGVGDDSRFAAPNYWFWKCSSDDNLHEILLVDPFI